MINETKTEVRYSDFVLDFRHIENKCPLEGEVLVNGINEGSLTEGKKVITLPEIQSAINITLIGLTGKCFDYSEGYRFNQTWTNYQIEPVNILYVNFSLRKPLYLAGLPSLVRPEEVRYYLNNYHSFNNNSAHDLDLLANFYMRYDYNQWLDSHWQTPAQTLEKSSGDTMAWTTTFLSLAKAYNSSIDCYGVIWSQNLNSICYIDGSYHLFAQGGVRGNANMIPLDERDPQFSERENKKELRLMLAGFYSSYGIPSTEREVIGVFNESGSIELNGSEDLIDFLYKLNTNP
jgi:hypothetical protein